MREIVWLFTRLASRLLADDREREALLGDYEERGLRGRWRCFGELLALGIVRQAPLWLNWRPWLSLLVLFVPMNSSLQAGRSILQVLTMQPLASLDIRTHLLAPTTLTILLAWCAGFSAARIGRWAVWSALVILLGLSEAAVLAHTFMNLWALAASGALIWLPAILGANKGMSAAGLTKPGRCLLAVLQTGGFCLLLFGPNAPTPPVFQDALPAILLLWPMVVPLLWPKPFSTSK